MAIGKSPFAQAMRLLYNDRAEDALEIGKKLLGSDDLADRVSGMLCLGFVYEDGGTAVARNIELATNYFRQAAILAPCPETYCNLSRTIMKAGEDDFPDSLRYLKLAAEIKVTAQVLLGFGEYYRHTSPPNGRLARKYFFRAALKGSLHGFVGYSGVARMDGLHSRAIAMDFARFVTSPLLLIFFGRRALQERF